MLDIRIERLRRLPLDPDAVWEGAWREIPGLQIATDTEPRTYLAGLWVDRESGVVGPGPDTIQPRDQATADHLLDRLVAFATHADLGGHCPGRLELDDPALAAALAELLADLLADRPLEIAVVPSLPAVDEAVAGLVEFLMSERSSQEELSLLSATDLPLAQVVEFGAAAAEFFRAMPWLAFEGEDLIAIEAPGGMPAMSHTVVLGQAGQQYGLGFYADPGQHDDVVGGRSDGIREGQSVWFFSFCDSQDPGDRGYREVMREWRSRGLPLASEQAYPMLVCRQPGGEPLLPDARELAHVTGLLRALARTPRDEADTGRWTVEVSDGVSAAVSYRLALPRLLEKPVGADLPDQLPAAARALVLCYNAQMVGGYRRGAMARAALRADPGCVGAWTLLAEECGDQAERWSRTRRAAELALERLDDLAMGATDAAFDEPDLPHGELDVEIDRKGRVKSAVLDRVRWESVLHALTDATFLGLTSDDDQTTDFALQCGLALLERQPDDITGVRHAVVAALLRLGRDRQAAAVLDRWPRTGMRGGPPWMVDGGDEVFVDAARLVLMARGEGPTEGGREEGDHAAEPAGAPAELARGLADLARRNRFLLPLIWDQRRVPATAMRNDSPAGGLVARFVGEMLAPAWLLTPRLEEARGSTDGAGGGKGGGPGGGPGGAKGGGKGGSKGGGKSRGKRRKRGRG